MMIDLTGPIAELSDRDLHRHMAQVGILFVECEADIRIVESLRRVLDLFWAELMRRRLRNT